MPTSSQPPEPGPTPGEVGEEDVRSWVEVTPGEERNTFEVELSDEANLLVDLADGRVQHALEHTRGVKEVEQEDRERFLVECRRPQRDAGEVVEMVVGALLRAASMPVPTPTVSEADVEALARGVDELLGPGWIRPGPRLAARRRTHEGLVQLLLVAGSGGGPDLQVWACVHVPDLPAGMPVPETLEGYVPAHCQFTRYRRALRPEDVDGAAAEELQGFLERTGTRRGLAAWWAENPEVQSPNQTRRYAPTLVRWGASEEVRTLLRACRDALGGGAYGREYEELAEELGVPL